jgi:hypothetical protein
MHLYNVFVSEQHEFWSDCAGHKRIMLVLSWRGSYVRFAWAHSESNHMLSGYEQWFLLLSSTLSLASFKWSHKCYRNICFVSAGFSLGMSGTPPSNRLFLICWDFRSEIRFFLSSFDFLKVLYFWILAWTREFDYFNSFF